MASAQRLKLKYMIEKNIFDLFIIGPESDHCLPLSLTHSLTHSLTNCHLAKFIDVTLACEDGNSKLVEVVTVVDVDDEKRVGNSLLQIWKLKLKKVNFTVSEFEHKL